MNLVPMPPSVRRKNKRIVVWLSDEDFSFFNAIVDKEKDTASNVLRRLIRQKHHRMTSPKAQALTLRLPQQSSDFSDFSQLPVSTQTKDPSK